LLHNEKRLASAFAAANQNTMPTSVPTQLTMDRSFQQLQIEEGFLLVEERMRIVRKSVE